MKKAPAKRPDALDRRRDRRGEASSGEGVIDDDAGPALAFLRDRSALVQRFVLAELLAPPLAARRFGTRAASASSSSPSPSSPSSPRGTPKGAK